MKKFIFNLVTFLAATQVYAQNFNYRGRNCDQIGSVLCVQNLPEGSSAAARDCRTRLVDYLMRDSHCAHSVGNTQEYEACMDHAPACASVPANVYLMNYVYRQVCPRAPGNSAALCNTWYASRAQEYTAELARHSPRYASDPVTIGFNGRPRQAAVPHEPRCADGSAPDDRRGIGHECERDGDGVQLSH